MYEVCHGKVKQVLILIPLLMSRHLVLSLALLVSLIPIVSPVHIHPATPHHRTQTGGTL